MLKIIDVWGRLFIKYKMSNCSFQQLLQYNLSFFYLNTRKTLSLRGFILKPTETAYVLQKTVLDIFCTGIFLCDHHWKFWKKVWDKFSEKWKPFLQKWKWHFTLGTVLWGQELVRYLEKPGWLWQWWFESHTIAYILWCWPSNFRCLD